MNKPKVLLYGDVDLNLIDGSAIWLVSMAEALVMANAEVTTLLKATAVETRLVEHLKRMQNSKVVEPFTGTGAEQLTPRLAARRIAQEYQELKPDMLIVRGIHVCSAAALNDDLAPRLWAYVTEIPRIDSSGQICNADKMQNIAKRARRIIAQTENARSYLESIFPEAAGKTMVLPPMVPQSHNDKITEGPAVGVDGGEISLVYSGKMARAWKILDMVDLPALLADRGITATLTVMGDKVHSEPSTHGWETQMTSLLRGETQKQGVTFLGGLPRETALDEVGKHDIGLSWRDDVLNSSLEVSTKVLEYASRGVPALLNDTAAHRAIFGDDYPLYVDSSVESVISTIVDIHNNPELLPQAVSVGRIACQAYSIDMASKRIRQEIARQIRLDGTTQKSGLRVLVASHDLKFASDVFEALREIDCDVKVDKWKSLHEHDEEQSYRLVDWADVVFCEWAGPNLVWYCNHKKKGQRLLVRLHRFETRGPWMKNVDHREIDEVVFVSEFYRDYAMETLQWHDVRSRAISNSIDTVDLARAKSPDAMFHVGIAGIVPMRKRVDRAVDLLERLVAGDSRFMLHLRGRAPWNYGWEWKKVGLRSAYHDTFDRLMSSRLRQHVMFEDFGPDMSNWFRSIGWTLSPSTDESFHLSPVEGMASGAVPVVWPRPGVQEIFGAEWVDETESWAIRILDAVSGDEWQQLSERAKDQAQRYDVLRIRREWIALFEGRRPS